MFISNENIECIKNMRYYDSKESNAYTGTKWIDTGSNENFIVCNMHIKAGEFALDKTFLIFNIGKIFNMYGRGINACYYSANIGVLVWENMLNVAYGLALTKIDTN